MERKADLSPCGTYRYRLSRQWDALLPILYFIMLNPSTADASIDDPTIRKCLGFAMRAGYGGIDVLNLFAFRATNPAELHALARTPEAQIGPDNDRYLASVPAGADVCFAWGAHARRYASRVAQVRYLLGNTRWLCLKRLDDGTPAHPLMLPYSCALMECSE